MAATVEDSLYTDIELFLARGLNIRVPNAARMDPSTETVRRKGGVVGAFNTVRLVTVADRVTDPVLNPLFKDTQRESYRLGDALQHEDRGGEFLVGREPVPSAVASSAAPSVPAA